MFSVEVLGQTIEQYSILLKTKDEISSLSVSLSKLSLTLFIWYNLEKQEETVLKYDGHKSGEGLIWLPSPLLR